MKLTHSISFHLRTFVSHRTNSRKTKLLVESDSSFVVFSRKDGPNSRVSETDGQYLAHFERPLSINVVTITINVLWASNTICQKSFMVFCNGPARRIHFYLATVDKYFEARPLRREGRGKVSFGLTKTET